MNKTLKFVELETGSFVGHWWIPEGGFVWDYSARALSDGDDGRAPWLMPSNPSPTLLVQQYPVLKKQGVVDAFAKLALNPTLGSIEGFANRWGWLGRGEPGLDADGVIKVSEPLTMWLQELSTFRVIDETSRAVMTLRQQASYGPSAIRSAHKVLDKRVTWSQDGRGVRFDVGEVPLGKDLTALVGDWRPVDQLSGLIAVSDTPSGDGLLRRWNKDDRCGPAWYYVCDKVNEQLRGRTNLTLLPFRHEGQIRTFPRDLLAAIYMHVAFRLVGTATKERDCEHCRQLFPLTRRNRRFCSKQCRELAAYYRPPQGGTNEQER